MSHVSAAILLCGLVDNVFTRWTKAESFVSVVNSSSRSFTPSLLSAAHSLLEDKSSSSLPALAQTVSVVFIFSSGLFIGK